MGAGARDDLVIAAALFSPAIPLRCARSRHGPMIVNRVHSMHSYDCPCIVALHIEGGNAEYLDWIENETG